MANKRLWIGTQPDPDYRTQILVSEEDQEFIDSLPSGPSKAFVGVTDLLTGNVYDIRRASCGLDCYCALAFVEEPTERPNRQEEESSTSLRTCNTIADLKKAIANIPDSATIEGTLHTYTQAYPVAYVSTLYTKHIPSNHPDEYPDKLRIDFSLPEGYSVAKRKTASPSASPSLAPSPAPSLNASKA